MATSYAEVGESYGRMETGEKESQPLVFHGGSYTDLATPIHLTFYNGCDKIIVSDKK